MFAWSAAIAQSVEFSREVVLMKLKIRIDDEVYEVDVEVEDDGGAEPARSGYRTLPVASVPFAPAMPPASAPAPVPTASDEKVCRSPIAGIVVRINVREGQQLKVNDSMLVLEAMKMETNITAPFDGVVKNIAVTMGQAVQAQQVLVEFE
jgi:methylmalonyl-CoA carboxyltransferase 1.3S subunit